VPLRGANRGVGRDVLRDQPAALGILKHGLEGLQDLPRHLPAMARQQIVAQLLAPRLSDLSELGVGRDQGKDVAAVLLVLIHRGAFQAFRLGALDPEVDRLADRPGCGFRAVCLARPGAERTPSRSRHLSSP
jgi:hypothetical protein